MQLSSIILIPSYLLLVSLSELSALRQDITGLKLVHLLYRHGDRTPINPYPNDPYKDPSNWPVGWGQLTSWGKMTHFKLGQWFRQRYDGFLSSDYDEKEIYVRSTDVDRTLMSAQSNLAGLYPPHGYMKWNKDLAWQPIPVHTVPLNEDALLSSHAYCPRFDRLYEELKTSQWMEDIYNKNKELFQYISKHSGWNISDIQRLDWVYDCLLIEARYNKTLPEWTKKYFPHTKFEKLRDLSFTMDTFTHEFKRLKGGPFVRQMVEHFDQVQDGSLEPKERKIFMYSAHDTTVSTVLNTLGVFDIIAPTYAAAVMFELYEGKEDFLVEISYRNDSTREPYVLTLPGCDPSCPLKKFKELTLSILPEDWTAECSEASSSTSVTGTVTLVAALASSVMASVVLIAALVTLCKCKREPSEQHRYRRVPVGLLEDPENEA
jgi:lysosomal acid phosphatase